MKKLLPLFLLSSISLFSQEKPNKLGVFVSLEANIGFDVAEMIRRNNARTEYEKSQLPPGKFNYGFTSQIGFQPFNWFALSGGFRYSYIDPNYHLLYYVVQPNFFLGDPKDEEFAYLFGNIGSKINHTAAENAGFIGLGIGRIEPVNKYLGHKFQIYLEDQVLDGTGNIFLGFSYGLVIFSNKNL